MLRSAEAISFCLVLLFLGYLASIVRAYLRRPLEQRGDLSDFEWHFFVPCRDEEAVIDQTVERLRTDFAGAHVWVVDDDSDDRTAEVVDGWAARDPLVHLVRRTRPEARTGKGDALNAAYHALDRTLPADTDRSAVVICVVDADGHLDPAVLNYMAAPTVFGDGAVGAAQVSVRMRNRDDPRPCPDKGRLGNAIGRYLVRMQDLEFRTAIAAMQALRSRTRSVGLGGNGQFTRLSVLDEIAHEASEPWHGSLLEDYELGVHVMLAGYQNKYVDATFVSQEGLPDLRRLLTQRTRWSQGNIQCVKYLPEVTRSRHFGSAAVVEASYYLCLPFLQLLGMAVWPLVLASTLSGLLLNAPDTASLLLQSWPLLVLLLVLSVAPFAMWGPIYKVRCEPEASWLRSVLWGLGLCLYIYYLYVTVPRAFARVLTGRSGWAKTRRNAEDLSVGLVAKEA